MHVRFWGAARTVTGSMHLLEVGGQRILLDCGLYQGIRKDAFRRNRELPFDAKSIDAVVLSHAHIDHSGNLPTLVKNGFKGKIHSTSPTRSLSIHMLLDSAHIQVKDVEYVNKRRLEKKQTPFEPLYEQEDAIHALKRFSEHEFGEYFSPVPNVECRFHIAGHMLGAAHVELVIQRGSSRPLRLLFSGDIGRHNSPILKDPSIVAETDFLIMEATYGDRKHPEEINTESELLKVVLDVWEQKGKLIIPAFSVGRTQEIVFYLNNLRNKGKLPPIKTFLDSPLAIDAHTVFQQYFDELNDTFARRILDEDDNDPLSFPDFYLVRKVEDSKALNSFAEPCIIISASGMCEAGRVLHHLRNHISKPSTTVLLTGFQAPHTLGRQLEEGAKQVNIFGDPFDVHANICKLPGTSGHADQTELIEWFKQVTTAGHLQWTALVHCEFECATVLAEQLRKYTRQQVYIPNRGDEISLDGHR
ncbi:MAG TPA: MBL fold metallo-hydrolase [Pirellulaceae bacterium]|nr:MBL fold metallo-hydrolase [Pirellulaceae bacterium]HMO91118.1 MBL fold metallo-hydrolase [Pirellulaceae bacterium]HMP70535.1 MBL fold metallo-hydrolase [Pirellulaceae bacterium]